MHQRRTDHPQDLAAALLLLAEQLREHAVVHGPLARHLRGHEAELVGAARPAEKPFDVHEDPFTAVFRRSDGDLVAAPHAPRLGRDEVVRAAHDHAIHPGEPRPAP